MGEIVHAAEVCQAHMDASCPACDVEDDDLWISPNDLSTCGQCGRRYASDISFYDDDDPQLCPACGDLREDTAECRLCQMSVRTREDDNTRWRERIAMNDAEIAEIQRGERHTAFHRNTT